jgi:hypothetical protein
VTWSSEAYIGHLSGRQTRADQASRLIHGENSASPIT